MLKSSVLALTLACTLALSTVASFAQEKSVIPVDAVAYIVSPADGEVVSSPFKVVFGLNGAGVAPAGSNLDNTGHHHLIIDAPLPSLDQAIPSDANHKHFGKGQTEAVIELAPGTHTLQLLLGDWKHVAHNNAVSSNQITITVK